MGQGRSTLDYLKHLVLLHCLCMHAYIDKGGRYLHRTLINIHDFNNFLALGPFHFFFDADHVVSDVCFIYIGHCMVSSLLYTKMEVTTEMWFHACYFTNTCISLPVNKFAVGLGRRFKHSFVDKPFEVIFSFRTFVPHPLLHNYTTLYH